MTSDPPAQKADRDGNRIRVVVSAAYCKGCQLCIDVCPKHALKLAGQLADIGVEIVAWDEDAGCTGCLMCTDICPDAAITVIVEEKSAT